jgi:AbrB family looped-hinge helix DNA binding protein
MFTRMSDKGQVVVPKALRDLKGWLAGTDLEALDVGDGVFLRPRRGRTETLTVDQAVARIRAIYTHQGPPIPVEELGWSHDVDDPAS